MPKKTFSVVMDPEIMERIRDAAYWAEGETIGSITEKGTVLYIEQLEEKRGEPFPKRLGEVKTGRPKKTSAA